MARPRTVEQLAERRERRAEITDPAPLMDAAAAFLAARPRSIAETRRRLRHLGYPHALVDQVIDRLIELKYLDDEAFARAWVESRDRARPRGESALRRELALKGVDREIAALVLAGRAEVNENGGVTSPRLQASADRAAAERLLERRRASLLREPDEGRRRQKAYALLARYGFDPEICRDGAAALFEPNAETPDESRSAR